VVQMSTRGYFVPSMSFCNTGGGGQTHTHWHTSQQGLDSLYCERARWETSQRDTTLLLVCVCVRVFGEG